MTKKEKVRFFMFIRAVQFVTDNIGDFAAGGIVLMQLAILQGIITTLETLTGEQVAGLGDARFGFNSKDTARENLREMLSNIAATARSMAYEFSGIDLKFRMPQGDNDAVLLAKARAFLTEATPLKDDFIRYEMDKNFLTDLQTLIDDFDNALAAPGTAIDQHVAATAETGAEIRKGMVAVRTMDAPIKNKYSGNVGKLEAWRSASHVEKVAVENPHPETPKP